MGRVTAGVELAAAAEYRGAEAEGGGVKFGSVCSGIEAASVAEKTCTKCGAKKPLTDYHMSSKSNDGKASWCKGCVNSIRRENRKRTYTAENKRKWALKTRYGLTPEQVEAMSIAQGGQCAVCKKPIEKFHIDHNHNTGAVRGLLCHRCNVRIGGWDDEAWLSSALRYMEVKP